MSPQPIDYDALAAQHGGTAVVDYDALAAEHGGTAISHADVMHGEIKANPGGVNGWLNDLENDLKNGTGNTLPGRVMKMIGAPGLTRGTTDQTASMVAGPVLGPVHAAEGIAETPEHPVAGPLKALGGALETLSPALAFTGPEAAGDQLPEAAKSAWVNFAHQVLPSAMKDDAIALFAAVAKDANKVPVSLDASSDAALQLMNWQKKTQLGPTINKFLNRITSPKQGPMTYEEARDFQQLISKMSADESMKMAPPVKYQVQRLAAGLKEDIAGAADSVGRAGDYYKAMKDYASAAKMQAAYEKMKEIGVDALKYGVGPGVAGYLVKKGIDAAASQ